jgi:hypothetical protein
VGRKPEALAELIIGGSLASVDTTDETSTQDTDKVA